MKESKEMSDCCNEVLVFSDIRRLNNMTRALYKCPKCGSIHVR